jgi:hypothetical protein
VTATRRGAALSRDEIRELLEMRGPDLDARRQLGLVFASFALVAVWPNPLILIASS